MTAVMETLDYPNKLTPDLQFLTPGMGLGTEADTALQGLHAHGFVAAVGLNEYHIPTIRRIASEQDTVEYCPNDMGRVGSVENAELWVPKDGGRGFVAIYDVIGNDGDPLGNDDVESLNTHEVNLTAYGWSGALKNHKNKHIPGAIITTAYRSGNDGQRLARERRFDEDDKFSLGYPLGQLVIGTAVMYGADARQISLETWMSNKRAVALYKRLGFRFVAKEASEVRPTLQSIGTKINGRVVHEAVDEDGKTFIGVRDIRRHAVLLKHSLVNEALANAA